jgi:hypothetical protein
MSDKDVDAQFADIIAHWNDVTEEPVRGPAPTDPGVTPADPAAEAATAETPTNGPHTDGPPTDGPPTDGPPTDGPPTDGSPAAGSGRTATPPTPPAPSPAPMSPPPVPRPRPQHFRFEGGTNPPGEPVDPPPSWRSPEPVDEPEEHFQPGPTAPLPAGDLQFWGILAGLVGGPLMLVYLVLFNREGNPLWMLAAVGITVAGFGLLVQRLPRHRDDDDDGAVL